MKPLRDYKKILLGTALFLFTVCSFVWAVEDHSISSNDIDVRAVVAIAKVMYENSPNKNQVDINSLAAEATKVYAMSLLAASQQEREAKNVPRIAQMQAGAQSVGGNVEILEKSNTTPTYFKPSSPMMNFASPPVHQYRQIQLAAMPAPSYSPSPSPSVSPQDK